jgi:RNA recognition motif-containing protein
MQKMQSFDGVLDSAQIHFSFISKQNSQVVTEASIREVFSQFGEVIDVCLKKSVIDQSMGEQNGYGFIHYPLTPEGINAALKASQTLCQVYVKNVLYDCCLTWNLEALIMQQQSQQQQSPSQSSLSSRIPPPITTSFSSSFSSNTTTSSNSLLSATSTPTSIPPSPMSHHPSPMNHHPSPMNHHQMIPPSPSHYPTNYIHRSQPAVSHSRGSPYGSIGLPRTDYSHSHAAYAMPPHPPVQNLPVTSSLSVKGEMQTQHFPFHSSSSSSNSPSNSMDYSRDLPSSNYTAFPAEDNHLFYRK